MAFTKITAAGIDTSGTITTQSISVSGVSTVGSLSIGATGIISSARQLQNIASLDATTTATIESAVANAPNTFTDLSVTGISTLGVTSATNLTAQSLNVSGIITATQLSTGASGTGVNISTDTISGPATLTIDPAAVGDNTGAVRIKGDLYVDGTQFIVNSTTIELADLRVGIATTVGTNLLLDGGGIGIGSANILKTITWNNSASALTSSEDWNLASGKQYEIDNTPVLTSTTLGSGVVNSSLTSVGTLVSLNVSGTSTFTNANNAAIQIRSGASGSYTALGIGRVTEEGNFAIASGAGIYANNAAAGDIVIRNNNTSGKVLFTRAGANASLAVDGDNVLVGTISSTGTASQPLQVTGGAYVSGNLGVGAVSPLTKLDSRGTILVATNANGNNLLAFGNSTTFGPLNGAPDGSHGNSFIIGNCSTASGAPSYLSFWTTVGGTVAERARIQPTGEISIGSTTTTGTASQPLQVTGGAYVSGNLGIGTNNPGSKLTVAGQFQSTQANSTTTGGGQIYLNGASGNRIDFNTNGVAAPTFTTRSTGTKLVLWPAIGASAADFALGIDSNTLWSSVPTTGEQFKWYAGTTNIATLFGTGELVLGTTSLTGTASQPLQVTGGAYVSGSVGIGTITPGWKLDVYNATDSIIRARANGNTSAGFLASTNNGSNNWFFGSRKDATGGSSGTDRFNLLYDTTPILSADTSGNIGVGVASPVASKLHVYTTTTSGSILKVTQGSDDKFLVNGSAASTDAGNAVFYTGSAFDASQYFVLQNNTNSYGRIGLVIRGKTFNGASTPSENDGWSLANARSSIRFEAYLTGDSGYDAKFAIQHLMAGSSNAAIGDLGIFAKGYSITAPAVTVTAAGNLGVGIANPYSKSHIAVSSNSTALLLNNTTGGADSYVDLDFATYSMYQSGYANAPATIRIIDDGFFSGHIAFRTKTSGAIGNVSTEKMRLDSSGNLGVGIVPSSTAANAAKLHVYSSSSNAAVIEQTSSYYHVMRGKVIGSNSNAATVPLFTASNMYSCGLMVEVVCRGTHALAASMWKDTITAWRLQTVGTYQNSGVNAATQLLVAGTHTSGTLSWTNVSTATPTLNYTQGANGYILESIDVYVTARDSAAILFNTSFQSFG